MFVEQVTPAAAPVAATADAAPAPAQATATGARPEPVPDAATDVASVQVTERPSLSLQIEFDFNSSNLRNDSDALLKVLALALKSANLKPYRFAVEGHTDAKGRADYNQKLSLLRAQAVQSFLVAQGVESNRLESIGKGSSDLANREQPFAAVNRRVRFVNLD
ncbi:MAG: OmpA family protein [Rhodoferax sp.]|nr:OmpA family protein [Rhodoferax sp.]